jgi:hypothetical protein
MTNNRVTQGEICMSLIQASAWIVVRMDWNMSLNPIATIKSANYIFLIILIK